MKTKCDCGEIKERQLCPSCDAEEYEEMMKDLYEQEMEDAINNVNDNWGR